jgi:hypothetical protein
MLDDASGGVAMLDAPNFEHFTIGNNLMGLIEYYKIIFGSEGLIKKECEFRSKKLSMTLDFIDTVRIPEDMTTELRSVIIATWQLKIPGSTRLQRSHEIDIIFHCINRIRHAVRLAKEQPSLVLGWELDVAVLQSLPLRGSDLDRKDALKVLDLLSQAVAYLEELIEKPVLCPNRMSYLL